jgi:uncharacterized protein (DUF305 family)
VQRSWRTAVAVAGCVCLLAGLTACGGDPAAAPGTAPSSTGPSAPVPELQPGAPGEDTTTRDPDDPLEEPGAAHDDVAFMQMMVLHHRQALEMAELVHDRGSSDQVAAAADRIAAAQAPEILLMAQWLTERSLDVPPPGADPLDYDHAEHGHAGMQGMLTRDELDELADAEGAAFDRLFLQDMIEHHEGAIAMAQFVLTHGADQRVNELATDIVAEQAAEIDRLRGILGSL